MRGEVLHCSKLEVRSEGSPMQAEPLYYNPLYYNKVNFDVEE
jgi:hypothetical protein